MRKRNLVLALTFAAALGLAACGSSSSGTTTAATTGSAATTAAATTTAAASKLDFDGSGYTDTGDGTFMLVGPGGTTEDGSTLTVYASSDTALMQIEVDTDGVNGNSLSYIFIDGMKADSAQLGTSQHALDLSGDALTVGTHKVELVQFEGDDITGTVTTYKSASYEIKQS